MQFGGGGESHQPEAFVESVEAVVLMSRRDDLIKMRQVLMDALDECDAAVAAQIVGQLRQVVRELADMPEEAGVSAVEKARASRKQRRADLKAV